jgi:malate dehydrogenase (oxaloacetate-decarboxylating)
MAPSVSYSITVRLEVASRGRAVSEITRAVEQSGGVGRGQGRRDPAA